MWMKSTVSYFHDQYFLSRYCLLAFRASELRWGLTEMRLECGVEARHASKTAINHDYQHAAIRAYQQPGRLLCPKAVEIFRRGGVIFAMELADQPILVNVQSSQF